MYEFFKAPRRGEVYNMGGGVYSNCSMLEAIHQCQEITSRQLNWVYNPTNRIGDHIWYVSDLRKFISHYPDWKIHYNVSAILNDIYTKNHERWQRESSESKHNGEGQ
jgi:CDP-paratose 2-epimerase